MSVVVSALNYSHPDKSSFFEGLNLSLSNGQKAALVGHNGSGKSTLLQLIAGILPYSSGHISCSEKPFYVPQHLGQYDELTIAQALGIDQKLRALQAILNGATDLQNFNDLDDDWEIEHQLIAALQSWGLDQCTPQTLLQQLSGGQKIKVFLAGITFHQPDIILLDEPSNHLDVTARRKLYELVSSSKATMLIVSHDRSLLNLLPETLELSKSGIELFGGNFDFYRKQKDEQLNALENQLAEQTKTWKQSQQKAREMAEQRRQKESRGKAAARSGSLPRIISGGLKSKAEQSTAKVMDAHSDKMAGIADDIRQTRAQVQQYQVLQIAIGNSALHQGKMLAEAHELTFSYAVVPLWHPLSFLVRSGDRIRIEGDNGSGKTTLLKLLTGKLAAASNNLQLIPFSYLYLDQDYNLIDPQRRVYEQLQFYNSRGLQEHELKSLLIYAQFTREQFDRKCAGLSGGEQMKLSLCCLAASQEAPDVLLLDEPTNNLDMQSLEVLTATVKSFKGTLLVISHDQYFTDEIGVNKHIIVNKYSDQCLQKTPVPNS